MLTQREIIRGKVNDIAKRTLMDSEDFSGAKLDQFLQDSTEAVSYGRPSYYTTTHADEIEEEVDRIFTTFKKRYRSKVKQEDLTALTTPQLIDLVAKGNPLAAATLQERMDELENSVEGIMSTPQSYDSNYDISVFANLVEKIEQESYINGNSHQYSNLLEELLNEVRDMIHND